jgi:hypothetical protein
MRAPVMLLVVLAAVAVSVAVYFATGGHFVFFFLPLLFGLPLLGRRRG